MHFALAFLEGINTHCVTFSTSFLQPFPYGWGLTTERRRVDFLKTLWDEKKGREIDCYYRHLYVVRHLHFFTNISLHTNI